MINLRNFTLLLALIISACASSADNKNGAKKANDIVAKETYDESKMAKAYFASGCFWCVEAIFESVKGVKEAVSGYAGGEEPDPTYSLVSSGRSRHAETVEVIYDPEVVSYETLLKVFFGSHDPTTLNQQGPDRGPQYRSAIFYQNEQEQKLANDYIAALKANKAFNGPITTEVSELDKFYKAEEYHQDYEKRNPTQGYVVAVSIPRLKKFQAKFPELLKEDH